MGAMLVGYARVAITDQNLDLQTDALNVAGCERIFTDVVSGAKAERFGLAQALKKCRADDPLVIKVENALTDVFVCKDLFAKQKRKIHPSSQMC